MRWRERVGRGEEWLLETSPLPTLLQGMKPRPRPQAAACSLDTWMMREILPPLCPPHPPRYNLPPHHLKDASLTRRGFSPLPPPPAPTPTEADERSRGLSAAPVLPPLPEVSEAVRTRVAQCLRAPPTPFYLSEEEADSDTDDGYHRKRTSVKSGKVRTLVFWSSLEPSSFYCCFPAC